MKLAVIGDIHGNLPALRRALEMIPALGCGRIFCLGDIVDGGPDDLGCVETIRSRGIPSVRGNHDVYNSSDIPDEIREWLRALPPRLSVEGWEFSHCSPREREEHITEPIIAWMAFNDAAFDRAMVGHAHRAAVYRHREELGIFVEECDLSSGRVTLDPSYRHLVVNPSLAYNRDSIAQPRFSVIDTGAATVEFVLVDAPSILEGRA